MVVIFPIGIPLLYMFLLLRERTKLNPVGAFIEQGLLGDPGNYRSPDYDVIALHVRAEDAHIKYISFLWIPYTPRYYFFEVADLFRKLFQTCIVVFIRSGTATQLIVQTCIALFFVLFIVHTRPYRDGTDNRLATLAQLAIFAEAFASLLICLSVQGSSVVDYEETGLDIFLILVVVAVPTIAMWDILETQFLRLVPVDKVFNRVYTHGLRSIQRRVSVKHKSMSAEEAEFNARLLQDVDAVRICEENFDVLQKEMEMSMVALNHVRNKAIEVDSAEIAFSSARMLFGSNRDLIKSNKAVFVEATRAHRAMSLEALRQNAKSNPVLANVIDEIEAASSAAGKHVKAAKEHNEQVVVRVQKEEQDNEP